MIRKWIFNWSALALLAAAAACSSSEEEPQKPVFPEKQTFEIAAGQTQKLSFSAPSEWRMISDKPWVRFLTGEQSEELPIAYGDAGDNTVTIMMKENGWTFAEEKAVLSMTMEGCSQPVFELARPARERRVAMHVKYYRDPAVTQDAIAISYADRARYKIGFEANFDWKIISQPEWLTKLSKITGDAEVVPDPQKLESIGIESDFLPFEYADGADSKNAIVLSDRSGEHTFHFQFTYEGFPDDELKLMPPTVLRSGLSFYYDKRLMGSSMMGDAGPSENYETLIYQIVTRNMKHSLRLVEYDKAAKQPREIPLADSWLTVEPDKTQDHAYYLSVSKDNEIEEDRSLYLYILPPKYEAGYDYASNFDQAGNFDRSSNKYAICVTQLGKRLEGFNLLGGWAQDIPIEEPVRVTDSELIARYGTTNIFEKRFTATEWGVQGQIAIQAYDLWQPAFDFEDWNNWTNSAPSINSYRLGLGSRKPFASLPAATTPIVFKKPDGTTHGVLIIGREE